MGDSPIYHLPWPELSDPADVPAAMQDTAMATDGILNTFHTETQSDLDDMQAQISGATGSFVKLGDVKLGAAAALIDFDNIPQTYADLLLTTRIRLSDVAPAALGAIRINGAVTGYYSASLHAANNAAVGSSSLNATTGALLYAPAAQAPPGSFADALTLIGDYADAAKQPSYLGSSFALGAGTAPGMYVNLRGGYLAAAQAVTRVSVLSFGATQLAIGSRATLYGMKGS